MSQTIENLISGYLKDFNLSSNELKIIISKLKPITVKKGDYFLNEGKICNQIGILYDGLLHAYYKDFNSEVQVSRFFFFPINVLVTSFDSFTHRAPSNESIQALEDSFLLTISHDDLDILYKNISSMNYIGRYFAELSYLQAMERVHNLQALNASQRIEKLYSEFPKLFNRISKKHLSSYLGINRNSITNFLKSKILMK